jgi:hypothetical protein
VGYYIQQQIEKTRAERNARVDAVRAAVDEIPESRFAVRWDPQTCVHNVRQVLEFLSSVGTDEGECTSHGVENGRSLILSGLVDALQHAEDCWAAEQDFNLSQEGQS